MGEWISVEDRLPKQEGFYFCFFANDNNDMRKFFLHSNELSGQREWGNGLQTVTHWQPLPEPPKEGH